MEAYHHPKLGYTFVVTEVKPHFVGFKVYTLDVIDKPDTPVSFDPTTGISSGMQWEGFTEGGSNFYTEKIEEATPLITGGIRWDGCSNWEREDTHYCGRAEAMNMGLLFGEMYDIAGRAMGIELE